MKKMMIFVATLFLTILAQAQTSATILNFPKAALKAQVTWLEGSPAMGPESKMQIQWLNPNGEAMEIANSFRVVLFMPSMGHGSSPTKIAKLDQPGLYQVNKIYFTMPGDWEVNVVLKSLDGAEQETATFALGF